MKNIKKLFCLGLLFSAVISAQALSLGDIEINSYMNQPLSAEIPLAQTGTVPMANIVVQVAPPEAYKRLGLTPPNNLPPLAFKVIKSASGDVIIQINTPEPLNMPILEFLLEVSSQGQQAYRNYAILLNPPPANILPLKKATPLPAQRPLNPIKNSALPNMSQTNPPSKLLNPVAAIESNPAVNAIEAMAKKSTIDSATNSNATTSSAVANSTALNASSSAPPNSMASNAPTGNLTTTLAQDKNILNSVITKLEMRVEKSEAATNAVESNNLNANAVSPLSAATNPTSTVSGDFSKLQEKLAMATTLITGLQQKNELLNLRVQDLQTQIGALQNQLISRENRLVSVETSLSRFQNMSDQLNSLKTQVQNTTISPSWLSWQGLLLILVVLSAGSLMLLYWQRKLAQKPLMIDDVMQQPNPIASTQEPGHFQEHFSSPEFVAESQSKIDSYQQESQNANNHEQWKSPIINNFAPSTPEILKETHLQKEDSFTTNTTQNKPLEDDNKEEEMIEFQSVKDELVTQSQNKTVDQENDTNIPNTPKAKVDEKIDLALAYMEFLDTTSAQALLQEVLQEGDDEQKKRARELLEKL